ncbi:MAG: aldo/keto reductase [Verrucomicrobiae bacterium]|nr:aldo/keto reductase [Verrucomicrobiae bacterium]
METRPFAGMKLSRLMLGTVQFGMTYGIANRSGQPSKKNIRDILAFACEHGVNCLDTAAAYGTSEEVLGRTLTELGITDRMIVVTKVCHLPGDISPSSASEKIEASVTSSLKRLRLDSLPICLFHAEENFRHVEALIKLRDKGLVRHIGASTATPQAAADIADSGLSEAIQVPANLLDHRFTKDGGVCRKASARKMAVFIRSVYLQGLILMSDAETPPDLTDVIPHRRRMQTLAGQAGLSLAELAMRHLLSLPGAACILTGVESIEQIKQNIELFDKGPLPADLINAINAAAAPGLPGRILDPSQWAKKTP